MRAFEKILPTLVLAATLAGGCSSSGGSAGGGAAAPGQSGERRQTSGSAVFDLASMLTGTFEGSTPGNELRATIVATGLQSSVSAFNLAATITGKYQGTSVRQQGVIHLEGQGRGVYVAYVPHFDPAAGTIGLQALRFTREELESACSFTVKPEGDGYVGETVGSTTCARALRGAVGKWSVQVEPGSIRLRNVATGETLRFRRVSE